MASPIFLQVTFIHFFDIFFASDDWISRRLITIHCLSENIFHLFMWHIFIHVDLFNDHPFLLLKFFWIKSRIKINVRYHINECICMFWMSFSVVACKLLRGESVVLRTNLIKRLKPRFNIVLRERCFLVMNIKSPYLLAAALTSSRPSASRRSRGHPSGCWRDRSCSRGRCTRAADRRCEPSAVPPSTGSSTCLGQRR